MGPEKLPRVARTTGLWLGKLRGFVSSVKADIDREIASDELRKALRRDTKDATVLIVTQRISTIMNSDQIVVLDKGEVVGIGRHKELMESCEVYREIAQSQLTEEELSR